MIKKRAKELLFSFFYLLTKYVYPREKKEKYIRSYSIFFYIHRFYQSLYFIKDHIIKKKYKTIDYNGEFSPELKFVLPHAYWHYKNGTLEKTISSEDTACFYFFSENHHEKYRKRNDRNVSLKIPNSEDHNHRYYLKKWKRVPLKTFYQNGIFEFEKPLLIISNKYNIEWGKRPINYYSLELLAWIFEELSEKYQIIYNRPSSSLIVDDNSEILEFKDSELMQEYPKVIDSRTLYSKYSDKYSFNTFQMLIYANCRKFISVHGGSCVLASYFGGTNLILSKEGKEHHFDEFNNFFPKLSGAKILLATKDEDVIPLVQEYY
ncbi:hypothetical protein LQ318_02240 [Aliifodinibius salicampi]|uniref:Glycosyltransferase family 61 protein n=1 Tax=Fodinibius salicampi TaxID=1920655 RepID=A0ABT3PV45_9BACT|nr:hypothetical protein [Fodinibius salicampi]MCW9711712.1 hypothetical protein [Fodinibius salicampi]